MPSKTLLLKNGRERAEFGCTTTWKNADGETLTVYRGGSPREGLRAVAGEVLALDDSYRLVCYSTPETIFRDVVMADTRQSPTARSPESAALAQANLHHLIHPDTATNIETHMRSRKWREK